MAPKLPQQFGPYTLQELIARGGMAEIYRATMPGIGGFEKTVAIKKILPHLAENDEFITMLIDEARIIVSINHANIAQVYDLGEIGGDYYIAMEYIHGIDLSSIAKDVKETGSSVPVEHAVFIASGIAAGLHVAHNKCDDSGRPLNIVHRDVSPHNILISFAGDVKIIDFGVAKARGKEAHTQLGVIKGKLLYMAPEQAMAKELDGRADLFALGLILYRMLTNRLPFEGDNEFQIYNNILSKEITPPRALNPDIPEEVNQICMMLLQRDPSKRYQDGYSAKVDLDRALQNISPGYSISRLSRWVEDNFTHLAQKKKKKRRSGVSSGQNDFAPSTPSRNQVGTGQMSPPQQVPSQSMPAFPPHVPPSDVDEMEDTVNLSMKSPEAQQMLQEAKQARARHNSGAGASGQFQGASASGQFPSNPGASGQFPNNPGASGQFPNNPGASGQFPNNPGASGQFPNNPGASGQYPGNPGSSGQYPQHGAGSGQYPNPGASGQFPGNPNASGQYPQNGAGSGQHPNPSTSQQFPNPSTSQQFPGPGTSQQSPGAGNDITGGFPQEEESSGGIPVVPLVGILLLLLFIAGMLAMQLFGDREEAEATPEPAIEQPLEPTAAVEEEEPAEEGDEVAAAETDAGGGAEEEIDIAVVSLVVKSEPKGATVTVDGAELGETPFEGELPKGEDAVVLKVAKEGFATEEVRIVPFSPIRKSFDLESETATDEPEEEKVEEAPKPKPKPKPKPRKRRRPPKKKPEPKKSEPDIPLLDLDSSGGGEKDSKKDDDDLIDVF